MSLNLDKSQWKRVSFGDVVANVNRTVKDPAAAGLDRVIAMEHLDPGELKIERWGDTADGTTFTRRVEPGQTLFGKRRAYQRKAAFADFPAVCSGDILTFEADEHQLLPEFLPFIVQSDGFFDHALGTSAGSLSPRTNWRDLATFEFDLPSLDEQKRIAGLLWAAESHRLRCRRRALASQAVFEQVRIALLTPSADDELNIASHLSAVDTWTDSLPEGWRRARIKDVARVRSGATPLRDKREEYFVDGAVPWVKTLDLNEGVLTETDECITDRAVAETSAKVVPAGSVLVAMYGGFGQIGRTARLGVAAATNQAVSALLELDPGVDAEFMHEVLMAGRPRWKRVAASTRKDPNITKRDVENFEFPLPSPEKQRQVVSTLRILRTAHDAAANEEMALREFTGALLAEVFGGVA